VFPIPVFSEKSQKEEEKEIKKIKMKGRK